MQINVAIHVLLISSDVIYIYIYNNISAILPVIMPLCNMD